MHGEISHVKIGGRLKRLLSFLADFTKIGMRLQMLGMIPSVKFHQNPSGADTRTDERKWRGNHFPPDDLRKRLKTKGNSSQGTRHLKSYGMGTNVLRSNYI
jgi:hypothetical protein